MNDDNMFKRHFEKFKDSSNAKTELKDYDDLKEDLKLKTTILDTIDDPIFVNDLNGNFIYVNKTACKFLDYTEGELMKINLHDLDIPEFFELIKPRIKEIMEKNELKFHYTPFRKDTLVTPAEIHARIIELSGEEFILSIIRDINELKKTEKEVHKDQEEHLKLVTDNMLDLIYQVNSEGIFEYVSPSIKELLGYEAEEIIGKRDFELISIIHPDDLEVIIDALQVGTGTLKPNRVQHRYKHADGHYIWVETIGNPLSNDKGEFSGAVYITRDITELKHIENQLKSSLQEKEVLLREIHHRVKNNMQIISSLLNLQSTCLNDEKAVNILKESRNRVKSMAMVHEELYRSSDLSKIDFAEYIRRLSSGLFTSYGVDPKFIMPEINVENIFLDIDIAIPCGLIINELVSNSLKHAFPAAYGRESENRNQQKLRFCGPRTQSVRDMQKPTVFAVENRRFSNIEIKNFECPKTIGFDGFSDLKNQNGKVSIKFYLNNEKYELIVADDGIGFREDIDFENTKTLGLQLINTLVKQLSGEIEIHRDNGTLFKITF